MNGKGLIRKLISSILVIILMITGIELQAPLRAQASADITDSSSTYLNVVVKYLHLGNGNETFDFNIKKEAQKKGAAYSWYIQTEKGNPKAVSINKKTGLVTAKAAGTAYIGCKITFADKKVVTPEAKVIVRNNITEVDISSTPENTTITAYHAVDFDYTIMNTEGGKDKKTQGVTRFEITQDSAGVGSADENGLIFPTKEGSFQIRAISFQSLAKYEAWLSDKETNAKYVTASSEWYTLQVEPTKNSALVSTQSQLDTVLKNTDITEIALETEEETEFTISKGDYTTKNLVVNAPNSDVKNYGTFKNITVNAIKDSTWIEYANGNIIYLSDQELRIVVESGAHITRIVFDTPGTTANVEINGIVDEIVILEPTAIEISGTATNIPVVVEENADGSNINSSIALDMQLNANVDITLSAGAEESVLDKSDSELDVNVDNQTSEEIIVTTNDAGGEIIKVGESTIPAASPSAAPTSAPTATPTTVPTATPTTVPTAAPTTVPTAAPTTVPTAAPTTAPTAVPTAVPTAAPTNVPTAAPTAVPTAVPTTVPTAVPTAIPTAAPTATPTTTPTATPTATPAPADNTAPTIDASNGAVLGTDFLTITLTFNEPIINNLDSLSALKNNIVMTSDNGITTTALDAQDSIMLQSNQLIITLSQVLIKENVQIIIRENSLKDAAGNVVPTAITTNALVKGGNTPDTAIPLTVDSGEQKFWIESENDYDFYTFEAQAGVAYDINITVHSTIDLTAAIADMEGFFTYLQTITSYSDSDPYYSLTLLFIAPTTGTYYLPVSYYNNEYYTDMTGCYGVEISNSTAPITVAEPDNTMENASLLTADTAALTRYLSSVSDVDWFKFEGEQVKTYTIQIANMNWNMGMKMSLYNSTGTLIAEEDEGLGISMSNPGTNASEIVFTVLETGTYYICIESDDANSLGIYDIKLTSQETDVEAYVKAAEDAAINDPIYALDKCREAILIVTAMPVSAEKAAYQARVDQLYEMIENAFVTNTNTTNFPGAIAQLMRLLGCLSYSESYNKIMDIGALFLKQNPVRNYTSLSELETAYNLTISQYNSLLGEVNSATDLASMNQALIHLAEQYPLVVSDAVAQAVLDHKATANYEYISEIFVIDSLKQVTFGATLRTVSGSSITYTPLAGVVSASVDGAPVGNGEFVALGKDVTFTVVPDTGYEVYLWHVTGDYYNNSTLGGDLLPENVINNQITFTNLHTVADVQVEIVKTPIITIPIENFSFSKSSATDGLSVLVQVTDTKITSIRNENLLEDILVDGKCSIAGDIVTFNQDYLSGLNTGYYIYEIYYENHMSPVQIYITVTD